MIRVLIISNSPLIRVALCSILETKEYRVVGYANNELDSLPMYSKLSPDVVIMDITMKDVDGISIIEKIISHSRAAQIVVIASNEQQTSIIEAIRVGAKGVIIKPVKELQVIDTLRKLFG